MSQVVFTATSDLIVKLGLPADADKTDVSHAASAALYGMYKLAPPARGAYADPEVARLKYDTLRLIGRKAGGKLADGNMVLFLKYAKQLGLPATFA